jgi:hypothetical protein
MKSVIGIFVGILLLFFFTINGFSQLQVTLLDASELTKEGLYFDGVKGVDYHFGKRITPHGDCIDVINGYVFVTWYKGGMDKMNLMVSRKKVDSGEWRTIEFPDRHIGYRGDPKIGDSHNTAAIVVCPIDSTVHLIYDMHAYSKTSYPNNYLNYRVTKKNAAFVSDEEWNIDLFNPKRHYLKENVNYEKSTYPGFMRFDDGRIMVELRFGGSGNGNNMLAIYDGGNWLENMQYNNGNQPNYEGKYSIYGGYQYLHGKLIAGYSIRYKTANDATNPYYQLNNGFFYSEANPPYSKNDWTDISGNSISLPVQDPNILKVAEPCAIGIGNRISMGPIWTVTQNGAIHFLTAVSGNDVHFYKAPNSDTFNYSENCPKANGNFFNWGTNVLNVALENNRVVISITKEGENNWKVLYQQNGGDTYRHFNVKLADDKLFLYLMKNGSGQAQPITLLTFVLKGEPTGINSINRGERIEFYPNPVTDYLHIKNLEKESCFEVYDISGINHFSQNTQSLNGLDSFDISRLISGIYFAKVDGRKAN